MLICSTRMESSGLRFPQNFTTISLPEVVTPLCDTFRNTFRVPRMAWLRHYAAMLKGGCNTLCDTPL